MNKFRFAINVFAIAIFTLAVASIAQAQATRTWVSGVGDDANPCSRTAPCKTFAGAISKTANGGEIDALDPAGYGAVTITKSITIDGTATGTAGLLNSNVNGIIVNNASAIATLRALNINGAGTGVRGIEILSAAGVIVENCFIFGQNGSPGNGILDSNSTGGFLQVFNTTITNCSGDGIRVDPGGGSTSIVVAISNSRIGATSASANGITLGSNVKATIYNTVISGIPNGAGVFAQNTAGGSTEANVDHCVVSDNNFGFRANTSNATIRVSNTTALNTGALTFIGGGGVVTSYGNNQTGGAAFPSTGTAQK